MDSSVDYHLDPPVHEDTLFNVIEGLLCTAVTDTNNCAYTTTLIISHQEPVYVGVVPELYAIIKYFATEKLRKNDFLQQQSGQMLIL